jgi:hypothetical protein
MVRSRTTFGLTKRERAAVSVVALTTRTWASPRRRGAV